MTAADKILQKALVGSDLDTAGWSEVQAGLRDRAFFSAKVEEARILAEARRMCAEVADGRMDASEFRRDMRKVLDQTGYQAAGEGIQNLRTKARLDLVLDTQVRQARGWAQWKAATTRGALAAVPAWELVRVREVKVERDWDRRWAAAGGRLFDGRKIALKNDPVWTRISRFGTPYPPFDFNSGMGVDDVDYEEAVELGLIKDGDPPPKMEDKGFNDGLSAKLPEGREKELDPFLRETFGAQVSIDGKNVVHWNEHLIRDMLAGNGQMNASLGQGKRNKAMLDMIPDEAMRTRAAQTGLTISRQWMATHGQKHRNPSGKGSVNMPLEDGDYELIPSLWRKPDGVEVHSENELELWIDTLDGGRLRMGVDLRKGSPTTFFKQNMAAKAPSSA